MYHGRNTNPSRHSEHLPHRDTSPPSIVYAPRPHSKNNYAPPTMIHHQHGAPGLRFSQSAPLPRHHQASMTQFPSMQGGLTSVDEETTRSRNGSRGPAGTSMTQAGAHFRKHSPSLSSVESGSTYYILPAQGQKVQVIAPDKSLYTATSTTQSPSPPHSGTSKRPFFSRFFHLGSSNGKRLQRRHSTDAPGRRRRSQS
jgi:hypothetical protein